MPRIKAKIWTSNWYIVYSLQDFLRYNFSVLALENKQLKITAANLLKCYTLQTCNAGNEKCREEELTCWIALAVASVDSRSTATDFAVDIYLF